MSDQPFDMGELLRQAQQMGEQLLSAQAAAASQIHEGVAGGGAVRVSVTGALEFTAVSISASAVDPDDVEMLEDLVLAALNDAAAKVRGASGPDLGSLGGLDLGGLGGLLGGGPLLDLEEGLLDDDEEE